MSEKTKSIRFTGTKQNTIQLFTRHNSIDKFVYHLLNDNIERMHMRLPFD